MLSFSTLARDVVEDVLSQEMVNSSLCSPIKVDILASL